MLNVYTVSFFGHRKLANNYPDEKIELLLRELLEEKEYVEFLVGRNGEFDQLVSGIIRKTKKNFRDDNCCHTLVLPYDTAEYRDNYSSFTEYYDHVEIYNKDFHFKSAIQKRNRYMIDRSDLVVFHIEKQTGGAYQTYRYAIKQGKKVIEL